MPDEPLIITEQFDERGNVSLQSNRAVDVNSQEDLDTLAKAGLPPQLMKKVMEHIEWHKQQEREASNRVRRERIAHIASMSITTAFLGVSAYFLYFGNAVLGGSMLLGWTVFNLVLGEVRRGRK